MGRKLVAQRYSYNHLGGRKKNYFPNLPPDLQTITDLAPQWAMGNGSVVTIQPSKYFANISMIDAVPLELTQLDNRRLIKNAIRQEWQLNDATRQWLGVQ